MSDTINNQYLPAPQNGGLAVPSEDPWAELRDGFDDGSEAFVEAFGVSLPRLKTDFGKGGSGFVFPDGHASDTLRVVILAYPPSRAWWEKSIEEGGGGTPPECKSNDMVVPEPDSPKRQSEACATCPWSQWTTTDDGKRQAPACGEAVNCFVFEPVVDSFYWLQFKGTALAPFRAHISAFKARRLPAFAAWTEVSLTKKSEGSLTWLVPSFTIGDPLTPEQVAPMRDVAKMAMESWTQVAEVMATESGSDEPGPFDGPARTTGDAAVDTKGNPVDCPGHAEGNHVPTCSQAEF